MREEHGYPELTDSIRNKILGLNAAPLYGVDPGATRCAIDEDSIAQLRGSWLDDPRSVPLPPARQYGPRTRREFLALQRFERFYGLG